MCVINSRAKVLIFQIRITFKEIRTILREINELLQIFCKKSVTI